MIRINLLKPLQAQRPMTLVDAGGKGKRFAMAAAALVLLGGVVYYLARPKPAIVAPPQPAPQVAVATPVAPPPKPKRVTADAVEEIVRQAETDLSGMSATPTYADLAPSQRIAYQNHIGAQLLRELQNATPVQVGFAQVIFTPPDEFYVHGLAATATDLNKFQTDLAAALPGSAIRPGVTQPVGATHVEREFSLFGKMKYSPDDTTQVENHVIAPNQLDATLLGFARTAKALGLDLPTPKLEKSSAAGGLKRMVFRTEARCDYLHLQELLEKMQADQSNVGLVRVALEAHSDDQMIASLDLLVYAQ